MKILFILPEIDGGGIATYYQEQFPFLLANGHKISVAVCNRLQKTTARNIPDAVNFIPIDFAGEQKWIAKFNHLRLFGDISQKLAQAWMVYEQLSNKDEFDIIETTDYNLLFAPWVLNSNRIPIVVSLHGSCGQIEYWEEKTNGSISAWLIQSIEHELLRMADGIYAYSPLNQKFWQDQLGVEVKYFPPALKVSLTSPQSHTEPNAVVVGRTQSWKGPEVLYRMIDKNPSIPIQIYWIGGDNYYRSYSYSMMKYLENTWPAVFGKKIIHTGPKPYPDCQLMIRQSQFLLVPSLWDTFNFTAAEAMGAGKIVLVSDGAGIESLIQDGINGFRFSSGNEMELAARFNQILNLTSEEKARISKNAKDTILTELLDSAVIPKRIEWFKNLKRNQVSGSGWVNSFLFPRDRQHIEDDILDKIPFSKLIKSVFFRISSRIARIHK